MANDPQRDAAGTVTHLRARSGNVLRLPRAVRREQIVRSAAAVFLGSGYETASMEDVARAAGVTRLIVYRIFESKEALYLAVLTGVLEDLAASFDLVAINDAEPLSPAQAQGYESRRPIAATLLGVARRHPDGFRLLWRHTSTQSEFGELFQQFKASTTEYAVALLSPAIPDPIINRWAAQSVVSHLYESICLWLDGGDPDRDDPFVRLLTAGVRALVGAWINDDGPET